MMESSHESPKTASTQRKWRDYSPDFNPAFRTGLSIQAVLAVVTALVLDFGETHRAFGIAFACQWAATWIIMLRRPRNPTTLDLAIVRYGIVPLLFMVAIFGPTLIQFADRLR
jgi:hypothetical protein